VLRAIRLARKRGFEPTMDSSAEGVKRPMERTEGLHLYCACGEKIPLPVAVSAGKPIPWPTDDPVQNFCCCKCGEVRQYSKAEVHFCDPSEERQSPYRLKVVRLSTPCEHTPCEGSVEILYVVDPRKIGKRQLLVLSTTHFEGLPCTALAKHKNSRADGLGLSTLPVVDKDWEQIQSLCAAQEW